VTLTFQIVTALLLVAANAFFVATEFAIARIRYTQVRELEARRAPGARSLRHAVENIDAYLAACQLGITIASIGLGVVGKPAFERIVEPFTEPLGELTGIAAYGLSFAFAFSIVTLLHVVLGELAPKSLAIARNTGTALAIAPPMRAFYVAMKPFVDFFNWLGNLVLKPFGIPPAREVGHAPHSEDELRALLRQSLKEGLIDPEEREFAENVFVFGDRRARQVMLPRSEIVFVTTDETTRDAAERVKETGHTRLPLCEPDGGLDELVGVVNAKDLLGATLDGEDLSLRDLARPIARIPESMLLDELFTELRRERRHIAVALDEYGTTTGLLTLEDILEEIVGEISDEFDEAGADVITRADGVLVVKGIAPVQRVADELGVAIANAREATIGGHVVELLGRLPETGEIISLDGFEAEVTAVGEARIGELRFRPGGEDRDS